MLRPACAAAMLCLVVSAAGCSRDRDPVTPVVNPQAPWCAEHGVPESSCTICHPELAGGFQAKGDSCAEHGLPESVCPACRGEASARADGPPSDGTLVRLRGEGTPERVGITTVPAEPAPRTATEIDAPARIVVNPRGIARVHAPFPGVVRDDIGAFAELAFANPEQFIGKTIELAGDELTEPQIAAVFAKVIGRPVKLAAPQMPEGATPTEEQIAMFNFFNGVGYDGDNPALRGLYPGMQTLEQYLRRNGWENAQPIPIPETS